MPATPMQVYKAFMDSKLHAKFTGDKAKISKKVGGKFSAYGGYIWGKNLVLQPGKKIVQEWYAKDMPKGHKTEITILLKKAAKGTKLMFTHKNVPDWDYKDKVAGWKKFYWVPMKKMFEKK